MGQKLTVMLSTEGTYPFYQGGVSTWCDILVRKLSNIDYVLYSVITDPYVLPKFKIPKHALLKSMPLWGTEEPCEHLDIPFSQVYLAKKRTTPKVIQEQFIPLFTTLVEELIGLDRNPQELAQVMHALYRYFQEYEYKESFKSELTWDVYKRIVMSAPSLPAPDLYGMIQSLGWIFRFFNLLNNPVPKAHVSHSSAAAFCGIPCVLAKLEHGTPILLTEHGVYLREQYLSLAKRGLSSFLNTFLVRLISSIVTLNYAYADQVSPVCQYNTRWETRLGVEADKIKVIYNGVDDKIFLPSPSPGNAHPTVVTVARIDPNKDILTLIRSAMLVKQRIPNVKYVIHGSVAVPDYYEECVKLRDQLGLEATVIFAGHTQDMAGAYRSGDVVVLSSISEAFPYAVVEAMMTARPVVATNVGGISEALGDTGYIVTPRDAEALAEQTALLLQDAELRRTLGKAARARAMSFLTLDKVLEQHMKSYIQLSVQSDMAMRESAASVHVVDRQRIYVQQGYTLKSQGYYPEAVTQFRAAVQMLPGAASTPALLAEISECLSHMGRPDAARMELERMRMLAELYGFKIVS
ncbi:GT4 family glycosyltransferase PelF [Paenibacillus sp. YYML68]|uniref:GT4 family glycosyltransferase PelF n=1 Tax=Paenibacillus sp. YYML68 TaxID=2909250 RepID=UPI0024904D6B|nr:GT4 family glycosyltransferase PelF [Paenibacillus sp. YYML68]